MTETHWACDEDQQLTEGCREVFTDGSLHKSAPDIKVACWSRAQVAEDGTLRSVTYGCVQLGRPQTSGAGEFVGFTEAVLNASSLVASDLPSPVHLKTFNVRTRNP